MSKRTRQQTRVTFSVALDLPPRYSVEGARKLLLTKLFNELPCADTFPIKPESITVKVLERHVKYTERGHTTPDGA